MFNTLKKRIKNEKGLSLVELLAVIVILAIVAAIAIPAIGNIIDSSRVKAAKADAANVYSAAQIYFTENTAAETFTGKSTDTTGDWLAYVTDLGTITEFTVKKADKTITTKGTSGGKNYTIAATTLSNLNVENGKVAAPFSWGGAAN